ncbi:MAG: hypothetical protein HY748_08465 [Elusimicrobia bacterium]|nr:hypothetical protein [Elusimicrobiota bacterium]
MLTASCILLTDQPCASADVSGGGLVCAVYGFDPKSAFFRGRPPAQAARTLSSWGVNAVFGGYQDPEVRKALRGHGIRIFAELGCFVGERYWRERPESRPVNDVGQRIAKVKWYAGVCPSQGWLRADIVKRARKLVSRYELDGVWLDFIRYPGHWEAPRPHLEQTCFCAACLRRFLKETGIETPEGLPVREKAHWILANKKDEWTRFKTGSIAGLVREVRRAVTAAKPGTMVGFFAVPWSRDERHGAVLEILGQDHRLLGGWADAVSPMTYHVLIARPASWISSAVSQISRDAGKPVWPVVFVGDQEHPLTAEGLKAAVEAALAPPSGGVILFSLGELERAGRLGEVAPLFETCRRRSGP